MISTATASKNSSGRWWQTLKFRLAAWNATVVVVTALVTLLGLRQGVGWALLHELDQVLINDVAEISLSVASSSEQGADEVREELLRKSQGHLRHGWYVELLDDRGDRLWASPDAQSNVGPSPVTRQADPVTIADYRIVQEPLEQPVDGIHFIRVGAKLDFLDQDMARIDRLVALAAGAVLVVAPLCGYWLAARAARVIGDIITTASRLRPSHLEERLPIRGSGDELDQLAHTINSLLDRIAAYLNTKRDFLANASHELRTPLAAIRSSVEVTLNGNRSSEEYEELLVDVIDECSALETLVNQLLLLSETEADLPAAKFEPLDLGSQVMKAVDMFSGVAEARGIRLRSAKADYAPVMGNGPHLRQLLNNLIDNAVKYTASGGEIVVALARNESAHEVQLRIQDTGSGIPAADQRHIFERFYRGESARSRGQGPSGTGLGLSICQSIVHNHGGAIHCESQPGRGTCITVTFPLASAAVEPAGA